MGVVKQVAVETTREHPFYVCGKGWCSCSPQRTMDRYELPCKQLVVGDCCLALSQTAPSTFAKPRASAAISSPTMCEKFSEIGDGQPDAPLDYSTAGTTST